MFLLIGACVGAGLLYAFGPPFWASLDAQRWERTNAIVVNVVRESLQRSGGPTWYQLRVDYRYDHRSVTRTAQAFIGHRQLKPELIDLATAPYQPRQVIEIYVDRKNPSETELTPGIKYGYLLASLFGLAVMAFAAYGMFVGF
ncbi:MAG: DUF3592 domain-containing protein [Pseudomonadota bacterium]